MAERAKIQVTGLRELFNALEEWDKKASDALRRRIRKAGGQVATAASYISPGRPPVSGWGKWTFSRDGRDLSFDPAAVARGFKVRQNNFRRKGVSAGLGFDVYQGNAGGSIFEVLGNESRVGQTNFNWQGSGFVTNIRNRFPRHEPRSLFAAYYEVMTPELQNEIRDSIIDAARKAGLT